MGLVTIHQDTGLTPYFMVHSIEPIFPFDLTEGTFLVDLPGTKEFSTTDLITCIKDKVLKARYQSIKKFEQCYCNSIKDYAFTTGTLVLVCNSKVEYELSRKTKPRYLGPMVILRRTQGGSYILAELDGAVSKLRYATFCLVPYYPHTKSKVSVTTVTGLDDEALDSLTREDTKEPEDEELDPSFDE
ncbi:hypothetical protein CY34DRAFT_25703 [Suillus luteus UH-Slu-Lm8-n1]|uniref:Uncharacterized protein n=1 Tax=Suillus luteus UH-Slu-Lm8-n1 TaxID=930992 RepID=A0A0D0B2W0_9AGAM|nr:hypothetical protein CY34DRAFT_25703 [Suillus luteus UH-Slu-Lm8-n1]